MKYRPLERTASPPSARQTHNPGKYDDLYVCVRAREREKGVKRECCRCTILVHTAIYVYVYMYMYVCVWEREKRERETERERQRERDREGDTESECDTTVNQCMHVCKSVYSWIVHLPSGGGVAVLSRALYLTPYARAQYSKGALDYFYLSEES